MVALRLFSWKWAALLIAVLISTPLFTILSSLPNWNQASWEYLLETDLYKLVWNTIRLGLGVGSITLVVGTSLAWIIVMYEFPGRKILEWSLLLPLAIPGYVIGFVFVAMFEYSGFFPSLLREWFGAGIYIPEIRSYPGVVFVMSCVLYPYVYLFARVAFKEQNTTLLEVARSFGVFPHQIWKVALPLARPSIVAGVSLVLMESLADFGTVAMFSYDTFTTEIYETWFGSFERTAAMQMAGMLMAFSFLLFWLENKTRGKAKYYQTQGTTRKRLFLQVHGWKRGLLIAYPVLVLSVTFIFPVVVLISWAVENFAEAFDERFVEFGLNTLLLGFCGGVTVVAIALVLAYAKRLFPGRLTFLITRFSTMGYALPGTVIAVGALVPLSSLDHLLNDVIEGWGGDAVGLVFTGSIFGVLFALSSRFLTVGFNSVDSSLIKITPSMDMAGRSLGQTSRGVLTKVHLPLIRTSLFTAFILVLVDVMKEMPATLIMRPFGFDTLATWIWQLTSEGMMVEAALPSLAIVAVGLIPISIFIFFEGDNTTKNQRSEL